MNHIQFDQDAHVGLLTINRPEVLNALNRETLQELEYFIETTAKKSKDLRVLIITGAGDKAFAAGADIKELQTMGVLQMLAFSSLGQRVARLIESAPWVTVAAIKGYALGGGLELALACDFIYAAEDAKLGLPEVTLGLIPGFGGTQRLARAVGTRLAKEMIMTGRSLSAEEAKSVGLVNKVCKSVNLMEECYEVSANIVKNAFSAVASAKQAINAGTDRDLVGALEVEKNLFMACYASPDWHEGMKAFLDKRVPQFK